MWLYLNQHWPKRNWPKLDLATYNYPKENWPKWDWPKWDWPIWEWPKCNCPSFPELFERVFRLFLIKIELKSSTLFILDIQLTFVVMLFAKNAIESSGSLVRLKFNSLNSRQNWIMSSNFSFVKKQSLKSKIFKVLPFWAQMLFTISCEISMSWPSYSFATEKNWLPVWILFVQDLIVPLLVNELAEILLRTPAATEWRIYPSPLYWGVKF